MTVSAQPAVTHDVPHSVAVADTHASTEAAHGDGGGGLPQFEFQHWFGQIVYLIFLFAILYWLMAKVFVPRLRGVIDQRAATIADAVSAARQVQAEAAGQAEAAKAEVEAARWIKQHCKKPVAGFIAGATAPAGRRMGHAGAVIGGAEDTAAAKIKIFQECGISVAATPSDMADALLRIWKG